MPSRILRRSMRGVATVLYHHGVAIQPCVAKHGKVFVARASILAEDGEATSLENLGEFASQECAFAFAVRSTTALVDSETLPRSPFEPARAA
jgi:hypothetical protein